MVEACFQEVGKYEALIQLLKMVVRAWRAVCGRFLRKMASIWSRPGALEFLRFLV